MYICRVGQQMAGSEPARSTHVVMFVFGKQGKEALKENNELASHLIKLMDVFVGVGKAVAGSDRVIHEQEVGEFVPGAIVVGQGILVLETVGADLHEHAVFGTAAGASIEPDDGALAVRDVLVLDVPEEEVGVGFGVDFYVPKCVG